MTDRELLTLAAKAVGYDLYWPHADQEWNDWQTPYVKGKEWNPLADDGDAFRLAVKLNMQVTSDAFNGDTEILYNHLPCEPVKILHENHGDDPYAATRRAIVRAAASIGATKASDQQP